MQEKKFPISLVASLTESMGLGDEILELSGVLARDMKNEDKRYWSLIWITFLLWDSIGEEIMQY